MHESDVSGEITRIETIARGTGVRVRRYLDSRYGRGRWRKRKGIALVRDRFDHIQLAELHRFEAYGIGKRELMVKRWLED